MAMEIQTTSLGDNVIKIFYGLVDWIILNLVQVVKWPLGGNLELLVYTS